LSRTIANVHEISFMCVITFVLKVLRIANNQDLFHGKQPKTRILVGDVLARCIVSVMNVEYNENAVKDRGKDLRSALKRVGQDRYISL
jgi:hypothetical protein